MINADKQKGRQMKQRLFVLFNHTLTEEQVADARLSLGIGEIIPAPEPLAILWRQVPPELAGLTGFIKPFIAWLDREARKGDYVLVQGEFGATYLVVNHALANGLAPIYSTTKRESKERLENNKVIFTHTFVHKVFRKYGQ